MSLQPTFFGMNLNKIRKWLHCIFPINFENMKFGKKSWKFMGLISYYRLSIVKISNNLDKMLPPGFDYFM